MCTLLPAHSLLYYVIHFMRVRFVEHRLVSCSLWWVVMVPSGAMERAFRVCHFHSVLADHLPIVRTQSVLVLVMVLVEFNHGEFLLKRTSPLLLYSHSLLKVLVISALVLTRSIDHLTIVCTMLFRISLVARRWICQSHRPLCAIRVTAIDITITVAIHNLVSIDED